MRPLDRFELVADALDESGRGVGEAGGLRIHAADLLPGEQAEVEVEHVSPHRPQAWGHVVARTGPSSPNRVRPPCPGFGRCGGCAWQHLAYPAQLKQKLERVRRALAGAGAPAPQSVVPAPAELGYRNKGKYVVAGGTGSALVLGAYEPRTHSVVDTIGCRVVAPAIDRAARRVRAALAASGSPPYDEATREGVWRHVVLRADAAGAVLVCLVASEMVDRATVEPLAAGLLGDGIVGVTLAVNARTGGAIFDSSADGGTQLLAGVGHLLERLGDAALELDASAFFQVNRDQALRLYGDLAQAAGAGPQTSAVDLYCGVGGIAFVLAARGARVLGIESHAGAVATANRAAEAAGVSDRVRFERSDAAALASLAPGDLDLVVVNPPRKGLDAATRAALAALVVPTIAYVSCGPESLARDLVDLAGAGYRAELVRAYDFMPGTAQVETLVVLARTIRGGVR